MLVLGEVLRAQYDVMQWIWFIIILFIISMVNQRLQTYIWITDIKMKLDTINAIVKQDKARVRSSLANLGVKTPELLVERVSEFFTISPVEIEPVDIIKRLDHLIRTSDETVRKLVETYVPGLGKHERSILETSLAIVGALNQIYKIVRHYVILGEKEKNWVLIMQLYLQMPTIMKYVYIYHEALDAFMTGKPIGDGAGPLVAYHIVKNGKVLSRRVVEDTSIYEVMWRDRRVFVIKAEGPGSNVGRPGRVLADLVESLKAGVNLVITIDAALKLEGEETGSLAEGVGAAIGDPGPEKIAIERATSKYNIPLRALVVKMDLREAITPMPKQVFEACERAYRYIEKIVEEFSKPNDTVIIAGIGNSIGIAG